VTVPSGAGGPVGTVRLERLTGAQARQRLDEVMTVYRRAFLELYEANPERATAERRAHVANHLTRDDVDVVAALDEADRMVGITYGVPGRRGVWWHDVVGAALSPVDGVAWLSDVLEVVELHVLPEAQGRGLGRGLLRALLARTTAATAALSALDDPGLPARHLYAAEGFIPLLEGFCFPGGSTRYAVLGKRLR
jgi:GNAT superfamily N-acetyltransferase